MAKKTQQSERPNIIEEELNRLFSAEWLREAAKETGFVKRDRKIDPALMFWSLTLVSCQHQNVCLESGITSCLDNIYDYIRQLTRHQVLAFTLKWATIFAEKSHRLLGAVLDYAEIDAGLMELFEVYQSQAPGPNVIVKNHCFITIINPITILHGGIS